MKDITTLQVRAVRNLRSQGLHKKRVSAWTGIPSGIVERMLDPGDTTYGAVDNFNARTK